jgi:hypothetical protein
LQPRGVLRRIWLVAPELLDAERILPRLLLFPLRHAGIQFPRQANDRAALRVYLQDREVVPVFVVVVSRAPDKQTGPVIAPRRPFDGAMRVAGKNDVGTRGQVAIGARAVVIGNALGVGQPLLRMVKNRHRDLPLVVLLRIHELHRLKLREAQPKLSAVCIAVPAEPRRVGAKEMQAVEFANSGEEVGLAVQQRCGDSEVRGELHEGLERRRKSPVQPLGTEEFVRALRVLRPVGKADSSIAIDIVVTRADDAIRGGKTRNWKQLLPEPLTKFRVTGRPAPPGQIA